MRLVCWVMVFGALLSCTLEPAMGAPLPPFQDANSPQIINGSFAQWKDNLPVGWSVDIGATNGGDSPKSKLTKGPGPSLQLSGDAETVAWYSVGQTVEVEPGQSLKLSYEAKSSGVKREGRQFDNCYIALFPKTTDGSQRPPLVWPINSKDFQPETRAVPVAQNVSQFELLIFLSKTGKLNIKNIKLEESDLKPADSFDLLVNDMSKHYSFFDHKTIDWEKLSGRYRKRAIKAKSSQQFAQVVAQMLDELKDTHVSVLFKGRRYGRYSSRTTGRHDFTFVKQDLTQVNRVGKLGTLGKTKDGFCYVNIRSLANVSKDELQTMSNEIAKRFNVPGFIIDLRENTGGSEIIAQDIAGLFANDEIVYAKNVRRNGPGHADFSDPAERIVRPTGGETRYDGSIVCLIGPNTVSSAEGFAMMMKVLPNCTLVGQSTRGASGNPAAIELPNGVEVWYSRWKSMTPDGICIEDVGVEPGVKVKSKRDSDAAYEKAIEILKQKMNKE